MSYETWTKEFYPPIPSPLDALTAARHSLKKWEGFTTENLAKHGLFYDDTLSSFFDESADTREDAPSYQDDCALCMYSLNIQGEDYMCDGCPLVLSGAKSCDRDGSPYKHFRNGCGPVPLIVALRDAVKYLEESK